MLSRWFKQNAISTIIIGVIFGIGIAVGADATMTEPVVDGFIRACLLCYGFNFIWGLMVLRAAKSK
jgi:hypothetical protein